MESMELYPWPGNVRELENTVERLVALTESETITIADLPDSIGKQHGNRLSFSYELGESGLDFAATIGEIESQIIIRALALTNHVKARTASLLRMNRTTLVEKMKRLGIGD